MADLKAMKDAYVQKLMATDKPATGAGDVIDKAFSGITREDDPKTGQMGGLGGLVQAGLPALGSFLSGPQFQRMLKANQKVDPEDLAGLSAKQRDLAGIDQQIAGQTQAYQSAQDKLLDFQKQQEDIEQKGLDRGVQYSQLGLQREIEKTKNLMDIGKQYNLPVESLTQIMKDPAALANLKQQNPGMVAKLMANVTGKTDPKLAKYVAPKAKQTAIAAVPKKKK